MIVCGINSHLDHYYEFDDNNLNTEQKEFIERIINDAIYLAEEIVCTDKIEPEAIDELINTVVEVFTTTWRG